MRQASTVKRTSVKSTKPKNRLETPLEQTTYSKEDHHQQVKELAYRLFVARGCAHGYDVEDWLQAEHMVREE